jgi:hypothetical protein
MDFELPTEIDFQAILRMKQYVIFPALTVIVIVGLLSFFVVPSFRKVSKLRREISLASQELEALDDKVGVLESFDEPALFEQVEVLEQVLPSKKDVFGLLAKVNGLATDNKIAVGKFVLSPGSIATETATESARSESQQVTDSRRARGASSLESIAIALSISGPFDGVSTFLKGIEQSKPLMKLTKIKLFPEKLRSPSATTSASLRVGASLELDLFFVALPKQIGAVGDPIFPLSEVEQELYDELLGLKSYEISIPSTVVTGREDPFAPF